MKPNKMLTVLCAVLLSAALLCGCSSGSGGENGGTSAAPSASAESTGGETTSEKTTAQSETQTAGEAGSTGGIDVDLTALSSTMVYSEVYNMMISPEDYIGKSVKMNGAFAVYEDEDTGKIYYACVIADATACCSQGIEFVLDGNYSYPADYPELGAEITVTGEFDTYDEAGITYCQLIGAQMQA